MFFTLIALILFILSSWNKNVAIINSFVYNNVKIEVEQRMKKKYIFLLIVVILIILGISIFAREKRVVQMRYKDYQYLSKKIENEDESIEIYNFNKIIFEKKFSVLKRFKDNDRKSQNSRICNLLKLIDLEEFFIDENFEETKFIVNNYEDINKHFYTGVEIVDI